jgi:hypothetical protein
MATNTTTTNGFFISTGTPVFLPFEQGVSWIQLYNLTEMNANPDPGVGVQWYWQSQMPSGTAIEYYNTNSTAALNAVYIGSNGFTPIDTTNPTAYAPIAVTGTTNAVNPVVSTGTTTNLFTGSIVRLYGVANVPNLNGYDFSIENVVASTSFEIKNALANAPGAAGGAGFYQLISPWAPNVQGYGGVSYWYPSLRRIVNITQAAQAVITTSVDSNYVVGQSIRLSVPPAFGMTQADGLLVNITAVNGGSFTVNLNTIGFTPFVFPLVAAYPFTPAQCVPVGEETDQFSNPNLLDDATINTGATGLMLGAGPNGPAGQNGDNILWIGGSTFNNP